jgi:hypothetical protein
MGDSRARLSIKKLDGSITAGKEEPVGDPYTLVICCAPAGAISCNGSSGITIQATR